MFIVALRDQLVQEVFIQQPEDIESIDIGILVVDVAAKEEGSSVQTMAKASRLVINLTGPYRLLGEPVVKACVEHGCDYVDITGESEFMERMTVKYGPLAQQNNVIVVTCCGFDSIPADLGVLCMQEKLAHGACGDAEEDCQIESFLTFETGAEGYCGHATTFECAVMGIAAYPKFSKWRKSVAASSSGLLTSSSSSSSSKKYRVKEGWFPYPPGLTLSGQKEGFCRVFPGSDASVVKRSQAYLEKVFKVRPVSYGAYFTVSSLLSRIKMGLGFLILMTLVKFSIGRWLLIKYPGFFTFGAFSHAGPTQKQIQAASFSLTFLAQKGSQRFRMRLAGPEPGYIATSQLVTEAALCILAERNEIIKARSGGGVFTPASAFYGTSMVDRISKILTISPVEPQ